VNARTTRTILRAAVLTTAMLLGTLPAHAHFSPDDGSGTSSGGAGAGSGGSGYYATVVFEDTTPGGGTGGGAVEGRRSARVFVPARCWWEPASADYDDPEAMMAWYEGMLNQQSTFWFSVDHFGSTADYERAVDSLKGPRADRLYWYRADCRDPEDLGEFTGDTDGTVTYMRTFRHSGGEPVGLPAPRVDFANLARLVATEHMDLPLPQVDRNPRVSSLGGGGTLVNVPTWFWVTNAAALGNARGVLSVKASIVGHEDLWVEVVARNDGLVVSVPPGNDGVTCSPDRARTAWRDGLEDSDGCTVSFSRASVGSPGGHEVRASVTWRASWTSSEQAAAQPLESRTRTTTLHVPVAEVQAVVTDIS